MRLDKFLVSQGFGSRTDVKKYIKAKRVRVNDSYTYKDSDHIDETKDKVYFDDVLVKYSKYTYLLLNKPKGYLSATEDRSQPTVLDLVSEYSYLDMFPVGRLDKDTTGCLLITNDGDLCHRLLAPRYHVNKTYEVTIDKPMDNFEEVKVKFLEGIPMDDDTTLPAEIVKNDDFHFELTIHQGKFHQVKRMFKYFDYVVVELNRKSFAFLNVNDIPLGQYRVLNEEEITELQKL